MTDSTADVETGARSGQPALNSPAKVLLASLVGTTIEFFDFYVYATAAVLVFPALFFPGSDPMTALLASFASTVECSGHLRRGRSSHMTLA